MGCEIDVNTGKAMIRKLICLAAAVACCCLGPAATAGPLDEAKARAHLDAVAAGDLEALMQDYADDAFFEWVGGPLDGRYRGKEQIRAVWQKWIAANGGKARPVSRGKPAAYANPKGATIEVRSAYEGTTPVRVWHAMSWRDGQLATEVWQIAPALQLDQ